MPNEKGPNIAEKVRFWEEQDKINRALVPRVLEMHDVVNGLAKRTGNISSQIAAAEARANQRSKALTKAAAEETSSAIADVERANAELSKRLTEVNEQSARIEEKLAETTELRKRVAGIESRCDGLEAELAASIECLSERSQSQSPVKLILHPSEWKHIAESHQYRGSFTYAALGIVAIVLLLALVQLLA